MAADAPSSAPAPPSTEAETEAAAVGRSLKTILGAVAAVLGVVASATALIFTFAPDLQPSPAPETQSAELSELRVDEGATFAQYLARIDQPRDGYAEPLLQRRGALLDVGGLDESSITEDFELSVALHDHRVRDEIATWSLRRSDALLSLLEQTARQVVPPFDAPVCTLLAWVAYARGDGSRVNVALDRALATDPAYSLANLLLTALEGGIAPREVRRMLKSTKRGLRLSSPG